MPLPKARLTKVLIAWAALAASLVRGEQASDGGGTSLESARRELQTLPANGGPIDPSRDPSLNFSVPSVPSPSSAESRSPRASTAPSSAASPSADWLLDAWRKTEVSSQARRAAEASRSAAAEHSPDRTKFAAENPFTPFLQQWISPRDKGLLLLKGPNDLNGPGSLPVGPRDSRGMEAVPRPLSEADSTGASARNVQASVVSTAPNPYLQVPGTKNENGFSSVGLSPPPSSSLSAPRPAESTTHLFPGSAPSSSAPAKPRKSASQTAEPGFVPPTAPLIDERRYFPQLHRF